MRSSFILILLVFSKLAFSQSESVLSFDEYKTALKTYHPVILQANLLVANARQEVRLARAPFDPSVTYDRKQKTFTGKEYYDYEKLSLSVPTWLGIDVKAGYENNEGLFTNDELSLGNSYFVGGEVSLTKGLYMNERRAALQQAQLLQKASTQDQKLMLNDLYYDAFQSYYNWLNEHIKYKTYSAIYTLNETRYVQVKKTWLLGNAPAIDTIEAMSQLQQFELLRNNSYIKWREEGIKLSKHIWDSTMYTQLVQGVFVPDSMALSNLNFTDSSQIFWLAQVDAHPYLLVNDLKQDALRIKQKMNVQEFLPDVGLSAYALQNDAGNLFSNNAQNNRFGINVSMPLRISKGRANYQITKNEILGTQLLRNFSERKIVNQVLFQLNEIKITKDQLTLYDDFLQNIKKLYEAENTKYNLGSSTIFLINSRENKFLDTKIKRLENTINYQLSILRLYKELVRLEEI